jgi:hypothetical protein
LSALQGHSHASDNACRDAPSALHFRSI